MIVLILIILLILLSLAFYWEYKDYLRLYLRPNVNSLSPLEQQKELVFHACFNYENRVEWRSILIGTIISTLIIWYILTQMGSNNDESSTASGPSLNMMLLIALAIFGTFYVLSTFKHYHLYRNMCGKIKSDLTIL